MLASMLTSVGNLSTGTGQVKSVIRIHLKGSRSLVQRVYGVVGYVGSRDG